MTTVREIEQFLFNAFPAADAMADDRIGLLVGDADAEVRGIALALDAKVSNIEEAASQGCNVLVSHHPVFWYPPTEFLREGKSEGAAIYRAAERGVALISMHTNVDCAPVAREMLLEPVGFRYETPLAFPGESDSQLREAGLTINPERNSDTASAQNKAEGSVQLDVPVKNKVEVPASTQPSVPALGQLGVPAEGEKVSLRELAHRYKKSFGAVAKVWGSPDRAIRKLAACSGGGGFLVQRVINEKADCYVTGEVAYHEALELFSADVALIELGHDRSELPYRSYLKGALLRAGLDESLLHILGPTTVWWQ